jgi:hypothetical protein
LTEERPYVLFQMPGETRLRAVSWDGSVNGIVVPQMPADALWSQSPDGSRYVMGDKVYDRNGRLVGTLPWTGKGIAAGTWSRDGAFLCAAVPETPVTGSNLRLETAAPGQAARVIATGFGPYSDNASYPVLACDATSDRVVVAVFGQGIAPARLWVFKLSTGELVRTVDYRQPPTPSTSSPASSFIGWVGTSADGTMMLEVLKSVGPSVSRPTSTTTIRRTDDGSPLATLNDFEARGFSSDGSLLVGVRGGGTAALIDWRTGRDLWTVSGSFSGGHLSEPGGSRVAIGIGIAANGMNSRDTYLVSYDTYLVSPDGNAVLLPMDARVMLRG